MNSDPNASRASSELASLLPRFLAAMIDTFVAWQLFHTLSALAFPATVHPFQTTMNGLIAGIFFLINIWLLVTRGQTFGKFITRIQVVDYHDNRLLPFFRVFILRHNLLLPFIALYIYSPGICIILLWIAMNLDVAPIFFAGRRCIHDYVACSKVVRFDPLRSHYSPGTQIEQHELFNEQPTTPQQNWQLARLEKRLSLLLALTGQEGDKEEALQKLEPTGLSSRRYFQKTVVAIEKFAESATDTESKTSAFELLARVNAIEEHL